MKRHILVELYSGETTTPSFYLDVFGWVRDRETTAAVGRWRDLGWAEESESTGEEQR